MANCPLRTARYLSARIWWYLCSRDVCYGAILWKRSEHLCSLEECSNADLCRRGKIDERFQDTYDKLIEIRNHLEKLTMTQAWSLRETDLYMWQRKLDRIDDSRRGGNFLDAEGKPADLHTQRVCLRYCCRIQTNARRQCSTSSEEATPTSTSS